MSRKPKIFISYSHKDEKHKHIVVDGALFASDSMLVADSFLRKKPRLPGHSGPGDLPKRKSPITRKYRIKGSRKAG
jgi:hypothetical protein